MKKNGILTLLFAFIPGAGQMYQGYMKRGLSLITMFCLSIVIGVSTLEVLFAGSIGTVITSLTAASILVFSLLYTPCVAAIASIKRELGTKWAIGVVIWQCVIAWLAALVVHLIGLMIGLV